MVRAALVIAALLCACGTQPEYVCTPANCGGCCQENRCVGVSGGCGGSPEEDAGAIMDAGGVPDGGSKDAGPEIDAGTIAATIRYDYPKQNLNNPSCNGDQIKELCEQTRVMSPKAFDDLVAAHYATCAVTKMADAGTIDCRGNCVENTYSCTGGGTYNSVQCVQVPLTAKLSCDWYQ